MKGCWRWATAGTTSKVAMTTAGRSLIVMRSVLRVPSLPRLIQWGSDHAPAQATLRSCPPRRCSPSPIAPPNSLTPCLSCSFLSSLAHFPQVYPSADAVIIVNAHSLSLVRVLAFSEAYPGTTRATGSLSCIAVDSSMALVRTYPV